jgi:hypothetical protein
VLEIPELVARYKVPGMLLQVVAGVNGVGLAQLSDWAKSLVVAMTNANNRILVRWVVGRMVFKGFEL